MPSRKSGVSVVSNGADDASEITAAPKQPKESKDKDGLSVDDISLPKSMIARLAKGVLPSNTQIHKDALLALHKSATVFVSYIASNSNELAQAGGKKTVMPHDVIGALKDAEFESFLPRLEAELQKYNAMQCDKRNNYRRKIKEEKAAAADKDDNVKSAEDGTEGSIMPTTNGSQNDSRDDAERPFKKFRADDGSGVGRDEADEDDVGVDGDDREGDDSEEDNDDEIDGVTDEVFEDAEETVNPDETMDDADDSAEDRNGQQDEALDEPDSD